MLWQIIVEPLPGVVDSLGATVGRGLGWLGLRGPAGRPFAVGTARIYLVDGDLDAAAAASLASGLFVDPVVERGEVHRWEAYDGSHPGTVTVLRKPGVMDPREASIVRAARALGLSVARVATAVRYTLPDAPPQRLREIALASLANEAIDQVQIGDDRLPAPKRPGPHHAARVEVPLREIDADRLVALSRTHGLSLSLVEMQAIQAHFRRLGRDPTEIEVETLAQTWSEHCKHKTFTQPIAYSGPPAGPALPGPLRIENLLRATIKAATGALARDFCLSVFHDNAGVIAFDGEHALAFKVETHNHPSAIEPYGGAGTGIGGVIRDILGTGLGARPIANIDVFCVGPPDLPPAEVPKGALHPLRILRGVAAGVRDYGNQMGIPTVAGGVFFDPRYVGNPLVYAGTIGILPRNAVEKSVRPGDAIVAIGGATGRDGIHGATFSSLELHEDSERLDSGAVQIGNAITEKKVADIVLAARDRGHLRAITDCGAGGFSSAIGELGAECGARVHLERAPLKYAGLSPTEIWISEAQERMVLVVPPSEVDNLLALCASEDVPAVVLGEFTSTGRLEILFEGAMLGDLDMEFLHHGLPEIVREARFELPAPRNEPLPVIADATPVVLAILAAPNVASKEWIIRQYDHEVRAGSVVKPLVGPRGHGPSDAAVNTPVLGSTVGFAVGLGMNPGYGDLDPYHMAVAAVDEAVRNVVAVGGDPDHCAILDNFSWGNTAKPDRLGGLVRAAFGCHDAALALGTPFISGKDSLNNEFQTQGRSIAVPPSLLVSALARVPDVRRAATMDLKGPGNRLGLVGGTRAELGGSHFLKVHGQRGDRVPVQDGPRALRIFRAMHQVIAGGGLASAHDLSEGGLAIAAAEMALAGGVGARIEVGRVPIDEPGVSDLARLFSESLSRFLIEVRPEHAAAVAQAFDGLPFAWIGETVALPHFTVAGGDGRPMVSAAIVDLETAFRRPLTAWLEGGDGG